MKYNGDYAIAIECFDKAIENKPDDFAYPQYNKGHALEKLGKHDEAIKSFDRAISMNPVDCRLCS